MIPLTSMLDVSFEMYFIPPVLCLKKKQGPDTISRASLTIT